MRTIAATFQNRAEAEEASRRLQTVGIGADRIVLRDVEESQGSPGSAGGSVFLSAKVGPEQIGAATEILKRPVPGDGPAPVQEFGESRPRKIAAQDAASTQRSAFQGGRVDAPASVTSGSKLRRSLLYVGSLVVIFFVGWLIGSKV